MVLLELSVAVIVELAGLLTVSNVTLNEPVPFVSVGSGLGSTALPSVETKWMVSLMGFPFEVLTGFQNWSTTLTVTWTGPFTYSVLGVPVLPVVVPGAAVSPGTNNCSWETEPGLTVRLVWPCTPLGYVPVTLRTEPF